MICYIHVMLLTCFVFSRICLRAISSKSRCRKTSNGLTIESDGFVRFSVNLLSYLITTTTKKRKIPDRIISQNLYLFLDGYQKK